MQVELGRENCIFVCVQGHLLENNLQMLTPLILTPFMSLWSYPNPCTYHCVTFGHCANWLLIVFRFKISKKTNKWKHVRDLELPSIATSRLLDSFHQTINTFFKCPLPEPASRIFSWEQTTYSSIQYSCLLRQNVSKVNFLSKDLFLCVCQMFSRYDLH